MAIKSLGLKNKSTNAEESFDPNSISSRHKTFSDTYLVTANSISDDEDAIMGATGIPIIGAYSRGAYVIRRSAKEVNSASLLWEVECFYDSQPETGDQRPDLVQWSWSAETMDITLSRDVLTGAPVVNSVLEKILINTPVAIPVLTISRVEAVFSPNTILAYVNKTNSAPFYGAPRDTALMSDIRDSPTDIDGQKYRMIEYVIKFNLLFDYGANDFNGWVSQPLNQGTKYLETKFDDMDDAKAFLMDGVPTTGFLKADGTAAPKTAPEYLKFHKHLRANLNALALGPF